MSTIPSLTPPAGVLGKAFAWVGQAYAARRTAAAFAGMSEREFQDVGWGQPDRWSAALTSAETPPERRARAAAVAAWHHRKAA